MPLRSFFASQRGSGDEVALKITWKSRYGVAFHGFSKRSSEADVYIGGGASEYLKNEIKNTLEALNLPVKVKIATTTDNPKFQGVQVG